MTPSPEPFRSQLSRQLGPGRESLLLFPLTEDESTNRTATSKLDVDKSLNLSTHSRSAGLWPAGRCPGVEEGTQGPVCLRNKPESRCGWAVGGGGTSGFFSCGPSPSICPSVCAPVVLTSICVASGDLVTKRNKANFLCGCVNTSVER